jgi:DNA-directed RNA polymerase subunit alpha
VKGAAITAFSIEGTTHEFTAIPGVREDVVDIMLNLKNIRFKVHTDAPVELELSMKGSDQSEKDGDKRVVAGDIKLPAEVEIANPNQTICHIDDPKYVLKMHLVVESGRGYLTIDQASESRLHSDMIAIDAVFTPVLRVRYKVENTRVGQDTNLQQLTLTVDTDGTITPREAFTEAAAILVNQYTALAEGKVMERVPAPGSRSDDDDSGLMMPIEDLELSARTANALLNNDIKTVRDLVVLSENDLKDLKGFGQKALDEVKEKLTELNF